MKTKFTQRMYFLNFKYISLGMSDNIVFTVTGCFERFQQTRPPTDSSVPAVAANVINNLLTSIAMMC